MKLHQTSCERLTFSISPQVGWTRTPSILVLALQCPEASEKSIDQISLLFAMEQHPCYKLGCKTGNVTEVRKIMSGVKMANRGRLFTISSDVSANRHHMKPVRVSLKTKQTNVTPHQQVTCVIVLLQKLWKILHGFNKRWDKY